MNEPAQAPIAIAGVSHHTANVSALETFRFQDEPEFLKKAGQRFKGVLLLQTCNRVELIVEGDADELRDFLTGLARQDFFIHDGKGALCHLFSLASGIDSMIVGEDQIIGQLKKLLAMHRKPELQATFSNSASIKLYTWGSKSVNAP